MSSQNAFYPKYGYIQPTVTTINTTIHQRPWDSSVVLPKYGLVAKRGRPIKWIPSLATDEDHQRGVEFLKKWGPDHTQRDCFRRGRRAFLSTGPSDVCELGQELVVGVFDFLLFVPLRSLYGGHEFCFSSVVFWFLFFYLATFFFFTI